MKKEIDFPEDIKYLEISPRAKRVLQDYLNNNFSPTQTLPPKRARRLRQRIVEIVHDTSKEGSSVRSLSANLNGRVELIELSGETKLAMHIYALADALYP